jgi:hypothetical protein
MFQGPIANGIAVTVALIAIGYGLARWGKLGGVAMTILVVIIGGSLVTPIRQAARGVVDTLQAPLTAAEQLLNGRWK